MKKGSFSKIVTTLSILFVVLYTIVSMSLQFTVQIEPSPTLTSCVFALFGTELAVNGLIKISKNKYSNSEIDDSVYHPEEGDI